MIGVCCELPNSEHFDPVIHHMFPESTALIADILGRGFVAGQGLHDET